MKQTATIDYETLEIQKRPDYPPKPVGVAITEPGKRPYYMAWARPIENSCTKSDAVKVLKRLYKSYSILCHNAKFDLEVGEKFMSLPLVPPHGFEDSMLLAFLNNPREQSLGLKQLADKHLGMPPEEQCKVRDWVLENIPGAKKAKTKWGKYIGLAPGKLVGRYAKGDVLRTLKLYNLFHKYVKETGMLEQYEVEKRCIIEAIKMERVGINIDYKLLEPDLIKARKKLKRSENAIYKVLGNINLNSGKQKVEAFEKLGLVDEWEYTDKDNPKTGIDSLMRVCTDKKLVKNLEVYSKYTKLIGTYMQPWLDSALENNGKFYPWINTIKGDNDRGTYTGRFSSNFQQVPRQPNEVFKGMPFLRNYIIPDKKSHVLLNRDFAGQELRILAHFEDGALLSAYQQNPDLDGHEFVRQLIQVQTGIEYERSFIKGCNFLMIYGGGVTALSKNLNISFDDAHEVFAAHSNALPDVKELKDSLRVMARKGEMFRTAGGRWYDFEEGFEYIALNTLIQGSAADHIKRAMLSVCDMLKAEGFDSRMLLVIHDEIMISAPNKQHKKIMKLFKSAMQYNKLFDVNMLTDGKVGKRWGMMGKVK